MNLSGENVEIRNFLGEKRVRKVQLLPGVTFVRTADVKDQIELSGNDINAVSLTCAQIQQATNVRKKDLRKFLDGIYVSEKGAIDVDFGVAFLFAGYDVNHGFQLYQSDPSGNYTGWKATVIGANNQAGKSLLKTDYNDEDMPDVQEALRLAVKVLNKTMDAAASSSDKMELFVMTLDELDKGSCIHRILTPEDAKKIIDEVEAEAAGAGDS